jgi:hypothetical protein
VNLWAKFAEDCNVFGAFWILHHAVFSAVSVLYLYIILSSRSESGLSESDEETFILAQRGQRHLGTATAVNRMCIRYFSILDELREEATKQIGCSGATGHFLQKDLEALGSDTTIAVSEE